MELQHYSGFGLVEELTWEHSCLVLISMYWEEVNDSLTKQLQNKNKTPSLQEETNPIHQRMYVNIIVLLNWVTVFLKDAPMSMAFKEI
jgi:hypothetical protein